MDMGDSGGVATVLARKECTSCQQCAVRESAGLRAGRDRDEAGDGAWGQFQVSAKEKAEPARWIGGKARVCEWPSLLKLYRLGCGEADRTAET